MTSSPSFTPNQRSMSSSPEVAELRHSVALQPQYSVISFSNRFALGPIASHPDLFQSAHSILYHTATSRNVFERSTLLFVVRRCLSLRCGNVSAIESYQDNLMAHRPQSLASIHKELIVSLFWDESGKQYLSFLKF